MIQYGESVRKVLWSQTLKRESTHQMAAPPSTLSMEEDLKVQWRFIFRVHGDTLIESCSSGRWGVSDARVLMSSD